MMPTKVEYFEKVFDETLDRRKELKAQFLELAKASPIFLAATLFFFDKRESEFSLIGRNVEWYNLLLVLNLLALGIYIAIVAIGFLRPPAYKVKPSPQIQAEEWDEIYSHNTKHSIDQDTFVSIGENRLTQTIADADMNDRQNIKQNNLKNYAAYTLIFILCSYNVLILLLAFR